MGIIHGVAARSTRSNKLCHQPWARITNSRLSCQAQQLHEPEGVAGYPCTGGAINERKVQPRKRTYTTHNVIEMAEVWNTGFDKLPDVTKEAINGVFGRAIARRRAMAEDLGWRPRPWGSLEHVGFMSLTYHLIILIEGLDEYYNCYPRK